MEGTRLWRIVAMIIAFSLRCNAAQDQVDASVSLPIANGKYDIRPFYRETGNSQSVVDEFSFPLTNRTRVGLALLQANGVLSSFEILPDHLKLHFNASNKQHIRMALTPPRLLNIEKVRNQARLIVFVHGLEGGDSTFTKLIPAFENEGWVPLVMTYANDGPVIPPSQFLSSELAKLHEKNPNSRIVVVAHSLGGIVAWNALAEHEDYGVTDFVAIGVPFAGSALANFQPELETYDSIVHLLSGKTDVISTTMDGRGEAIDALKINSSIRQEILAKQLPSKVRLHLVVGSGGPVPKENQASLIHAVEKWISSKKPSEEFASNLRAVATSEEIISGLGDGAVSVQSAKAVKQYSTIRIFDRSHIGIIGSSDEDNEVIRHIQSVLN